MKPAPVLDKYAKCTLAERHCGDWNSSKENQRSQITVAALKMNSLQVQDKTDELLLESLEKHACFCSSAILILWIASEKMAFAAPDYNVITIPD